MENPGRPAGTVTAGDGKRRRRSLRTVAVLTAVCGLVAAVVLWWPRSTVVKVVGQPPGIAYADSSPHVAVLRRVRAPIAAAGLSREHYEVVLGRDPGGDYGHRVRLDATGMNAADLSVDWTPDGAWLTYRSGHRVFVPASSFIGGR